MLERLAGQEVAQIVEGMRSRGLDVRHLGAALGVELKRLSEPQRWLPLERVIELFDRATSQSGDPLVGLHLGARAPPRSLLHYAAMAQPTVGAYLEAIFRHQALAFGNRPLCARARDDGSMALTIVVGADGDRWRGLTDYWFASIHSAIRRITSPAVRPSELLLCSAEGDVAAYRRLYKCPVRYGEGESGLAYSASARRHALETSNSAIASRLSAYAELQVEAITAATLTERARAAVQALLILRQSCDRASAAWQLGLSVSALRRRLRLEKTSFRRVLDRARRELALEWIGHGRRAIHEIAERCGFKDEAAFCRAFRRWTGQGPRSYRQPS